MNKRVISRKKTENASVSIDKDLLYWLDGQVLVRRLSRSRLLNEYICAAMFQTESHSQPIKDDAGTFTPAAARESIAQPAPDQKARIAEQMANLRAEDDRATAARLMAERERRESNRGRITVHGNEKDDPPYEKPDRPDVGRKKSTRAVVRDPFT